MATTVSGSESTTADVSTETIDPVARNTAVSVVMCLVCLSSLGLNITGVYYFSTTRRLRPPQNYLLVSIAIADILAAILWVLPGLVTSSTWTWILGDSFCQVEGFAATWFYSVNILTLLAVAIERFMRFWMPSRHRTTFRKDIVIAMVFSLWLFAVVFALMPLVGWGNFAYVPQRFNCVMNFGASYSLLDFFTAAAFAIPAFGCFLFFILSFAKVASSKRKVTSSGDVILEERADRQEETYAEKLARTENKYKNVANNRRKPKLGKSNTTKRSDTAEIIDAGYNGGVEREADAVDTDESDVPDSETDDYYLDYSDGVRKREERRTRGNDRRIWRFQERDLDMTVTMTITFTVFFLLWIPYIIVNYIWIYDYYPGYSTEALHVAVMVLAMFSVVYKPLIYLTNARIRRIVRQTIETNREGRMRKKRVKSQINAT